MEVQAINKKLFSGFLTLTFRKAALLAINFITINIVLARILPVSTIGIFNVANSILGFFTYFSDIGLAAALIQKKEIVHNDLKTTFTIQQILALGISVILIIFAPQLAQFYQLDQHGMWLIRALAAGFFLSSLKVIPSVLLERELNFGKLVWVEIAETAVFNSILIWLSFNNYGVSAFAWAVLARGLVGVFSIYLVAPWQIALGFSKESAKALINFGLPFQANSLLALLKDRLVPLVIARMVGTVGVGYITWGQSMAFMALEVMNIMTRISFPAFSRLQDDKEALKKTLERTVFLTGLMLYPMLFGLIAIVPSLVLHVVSTKWQPALPMVYLFSITAFWATLSTPFTNFLNAIGKIGITLKLMIMWTTLEWIITPVLTYYYGFIGVGYASALIAFTSIIPIMIIKRTINIAVWENIWQTILASSIMAVTTYFVAQYLVVDFLTLLVTVAIGGSIYLLLMLLLAKDKVFLSIKSIRNG